MSTKLHFCGQASIWPREEGTEKPRFRRFPIPLQGATVVLGLEKRTLVLFFRTGLSELCHHENGSLAGRRRRSVLEARPSRRAPGTGALIMKS